MTAKQIVSHFYGFGNINLEKLNSPKTKITGIDGSGKFAQKLQMKQRQIEVSTV